MTWQQLDDAKIPVSTLSIDRGELTQCRHWSEIVNHDQVVAEFKRREYLKSDEYKASKELERNLEAEERANQIEQEEKQKKAADALLVAAYEEKEKKKQDREAEKLRVANLTGALASIKSN